MGIDAPTGSLRSTVGAATEPESATEPANDFVPASIALEARDLDVYDEGVDPGRSVENPEHDRVEDYITGTFG